MASPRPYRCAECGARYTLAGAYRAMSRGCKAGCSGLDISDCPEDPTPAQREVLERAAAGGCISVDRYSVVSSIYRRGRR